MANNDVKPVIEQDLSKSPYDVKRVIVKIAIDKGKAGKIALLTNPELSNYIDVRSRNPMFKMDINGVKEESLISFASKGIYSFDASKGKDAGFAPVCSVTTYVLGKSGKSGYEQGDLIVTCYVKDKGDYDAIMAYKKPDELLSKADVDAYGVGTIDIRPYTTGVFSMRQTSPSSTEGAWDFKKESNDANTECSGAGVSGAELDEVGFMDFARLIESIGVTKNLNSSFNADGTMTIHEYLQNNLSRFYHQLYYIPTLKNNMAIVVKPETLFTRAPSCNVIYPNVKSNLSYSRNIRMEPTRVMQYTDPIQPLGGFGNVASQLITILGVDESPVKNTIDGEELPATRFGMPVYNTYVKSFVKHNDLTLKTHSPMTDITSYEKRNGLYGLKTQRGADMYLYLAARKEEKGANGKKQSIYSFSNTSMANDLNTLGQGLGKLARYELISTRYKSRAGSASMYFNPYLVPGFPFVSLEPNISGLNVFGYITDIAHSITDREWTTTVNFNCAHGDVEYAPVAFPIVEYEWTRGLSGTYKDMLGDTVTEVTNADIPNLINNYNTDKPYASTSMRKAWREITSLDEYLKDIADGATIQEEQNFVWLKNAEGNEFFDSELQNRIREYSADVMQYHIPFTNNDLR